MHVGNTGDGNVHVDDEPDHAEGQIEQKVDTKCFRCGVCEFKRFPMKVHEFFNVKRDHFGFLKLELMNKLQPFVNPLQTNFNHIAQTTHHTLHRYWIDQTQDVQIERQVRVNTGVILRNHCT
uniref:Uncharacterized protein n=1 Tax=Cacopsylla melanoneura TaxID=428564 RepID=A0A8D8YTE0_9HEMI